MAKQRDRLVDNHVHANRIREIHGLRPVALCPECDTPLVTHHDVPECASDVSECVRCGWTDFDARMAAYAERIHAEDPDAYFSMD